MLKKIMIMLVAAMFSFSTAGCGFWNAETNTVDVDEFKVAINQVIDEAEKACGFQPTVETVAALIAAYNLSVGAAVGSVAVLTRVICTAVENTPRMASPDGKPVYEVDVVGKDGKTTKVLITGKKV